MSEWEDEWVSEWVNEGKSEWVNEWMSEKVRCGFCECIWDINLWLFF